MIFYTWFDEQASQLRFSLISDLHEKLPFRSEIIWTDLPTLINMFLNSKATILFSEIELYDAKDAPMKQSDEPEFRVNVFKKAIP